MPFKLVAQLKSMPVRSKARVRSLLSTTSIGISGLRRCQLLGQSGNNIRTFGWLRVDEGEVFRIAIRNLDSAWIDHVGQHMAIEPELLTIEVLGEL